MGELSQVSAGFGSSPDRRVTAAPGIQLAVYHLPGSTPAVYLAHATGFCAGSWRAVVDELRGSGRTSSITGWDARHHGSSSSGPRPVSWWDIAADIPAIVDAFPPEGPAIGVGHSMGGASLLMAQAEHRLFDVLVLVEPIIQPLPIARVDHPLVGLALRRRREFPSRADARANFAGKPPFSTWDPRALDGYVEGGIVEEAGHARLACEPEDEAEVFRGAGEHGMVDRLGEIDIPVLVLVGSDTDTYPVGWAEEFTTRMPGGVVEVIDGGTHFLPMERPGLVARRVVAAATGVTGSRFS